MRCLFLFSTLTVLAGSTFGNDTTYVMSGSIASTYHYQGGALLPYEPSETSMRNCLLYVVELTLTDSPPLLVDSLMSDKEGNFSIELPPGQYGFVEKIDLDSLHIRQYLPRGSFFSSRYESSSVSWMLSPGGSIDLRSDINK